MPKLLDILNANVGKTPDQIVVAITPQTIFVLGQFDPWCCPPELSGRRVLIKYKARPEMGWSWWRSPGDGASPRRSDAYEWDIDTAFSRFRPDIHYVPEVELHLVPE